MTTTLLATQDDHCMSNLVLTTYELVEAILHQLPTKDLLLSQRVSRAWRDVVARSQKLQRALSLLPVKGGPLLNNWRFDEDLADLWAYHCSTKPMRVFQNPLLVHLQEAVADTEGPSLEQHLHPTWQRLEASWRKMLVSQPGTINTVKSGLRFIRQTKAGEPLRAANLLLMAEEGRYAQLGGAKIDGIKKWRTLESNEQLEELPVEEKDK